MVGLYQCCLVPNIVCHLKSFLILCLFLSALGLWFFIRRGKQCLDFTVTVHFFHMIGCWIYNAHLPAALSWWLVNVACMALMAVIGEYLCMRTELRAIPVNTAPKSNLWGLFRDRFSTAGVRSRFGRTGVLTNAAVVWAEVTWLFCDVLVTSLYLIRMTLRCATWVTRCDFPHSALWRHSHHFKRTIVIILI